MSVEEGEYIGFDGNTLDLVERLRLEEELTTIAKLNNNIVNNVVLGSQLSVAEHKYVLQYEVS